MNSEKPGLMHQLTLKWDQPQSQKLRDKQQRRRETALLMMTKHDRLRLAIFSPSMIDAKLIQNLFGCKYDFKTVFLSTFLLQ